MYNHLLVLFGLNLFAIITSNAVQITGWVYADNWFELYFNGVKVATDPLYFYPHNAVYINFTAPDTGLYSFAFWAQDYANSSTGLEPRITPDNGFGGWCVGDGGITMVLSDGTVTSSDWMCYVVMEGPVESECQVADSNPACVANNYNQNQCTVQYNDYPSCWNETICASAIEANGWVTATEWTQGDIGWGRSPKTDPETFGYTYPEVCSGLDATSTTKIYETDGCVPADKDWGSAVPIWTDDLDYDNRLICRYSYCVGGGTNCGVVTESPTTQAPSNSPTTASPTTAAPTDENGTAKPTTAKPTTSRPTTAKPTNKPSKVPTSSSETDTGSPSSSDDGKGISTAAMIMIIIVICIAVLIFGYVAIRCIKARKASNNPSNYRSMGDQQWDQRL